MSYETNICTIKNKEENIFLLIGWNESSKVEYPYNLLLAR